MLGEGEGMELKFVLTETKDQHRQLRRKAVKTLEDSIQNMSTCARESRHHYQLKTVVYNSRMNYVESSY